MGKGLGPGKSWLQFWNQLIQYNEFLYYLEEKTISQRIEIPKFSKKTSIHSKNNFPKILFRNIFVKRLNFFLSFINSSGFYLNFCVLIQNLKFFSSLRIFFRRLSDWASDFLSDFLSSGLELQNQTDSLHQLQNFSHPLSAQRKIRSNKISPVVNANSIKYHRFRSPRAKNLLFGVEKNLIS